jgi:hypothetical protein
MAAPGRVFTVGPLVFSLPHNELQKSVAGAAEQQIAVATGERETPIPLDQSDRNVAS